MIKANNKPEAPMPEKKIEDFPSILDVEEHIQKQSVQSHPKMPWTRWVILALIVLIFVLTMSSIVQNNPVVLSNGNGSVSGTIINRMATPVSAVVFLLKSDLSTTTDQNGSFLLRDIPSGSRKIIVAYDGIGHEIPVLIEAGSTVELGQIRVETTQVAAVH